MKKFILLIFLLLCGCQGAIYSGVSFLSKRLCDDRSFQNDVSDAKIAFDINKSLAQKDMKLPLDTNISVFEGEVLLLGYIPNINTVQEILKIVWNVNGVHKVYNYIKIAPTPQILDNSYDAYLTKKIESQLFLTKGIKSANFVVAVENKVAYLMGITQDESEHEKIVGVIDNIGGVQKLVDLTHFLK